MSLIQVRTQSTGPWTNPFDGQQNPYVGLDSSVSYDDGPQGTVVNSYSLQGSLTGCSVDELMTLRDNLVEAFDWKANTGIIENIKINGVVEASSKRQVIPTSLSFDSSNYLGALTYSMSLEVFTGFEAGDADDLYNKTHTVSKSIAEDGCITINTTIGCEPNANLGHCDAIEKANEWISGQLGMTKLGQITMQSSYELLNESLDIDPLSSSLSYSRTESNCKDGAPNTADGGLAGLHFAYCIDSSTDQGACSKASQQVTKRYQGEVYDTGKSITELVGEIKSRLFETMDGVTDFTATYDESQSNVVFSATKLTDGDDSPLSVPQDVTVNNYTLTTTTNYNGADGAVTVGSVNGRVYIENPINRKSLEINDEFDPTTMIDVAKGVCSGPTKLSQQSVTYDNVQGGINYNYGFTEDQGPDGGVPSLEGVSGLVSWSINYTPALQKHDFVANLNCDDLILDLGYAERGSIGVKVNSVSGSGYDFESVATKKAEDLANTMARNREELQVDEDRIQIEGESATYTYSATFSAASVVTEGNVIGELY